MTSESNFAATITTSCLAMDSDTMVEVNRVADRFFKGDLESAFDAMKATGMPLTYDATAPLIMQRMPQDPVDAEQELASGVGRNNMPVAHRLMHSLRGDPFPVPSLETEATSGIIDKLKQKGKALLQKGAAKAQSVVGKAAAAADKKLGKLAGQPRSDPLVEIDTVDGIQTFSAAVASEARQMRSGMPQEGNRGGDDPASTKAALDSLVAFLRSPSSVPTGIATNSDSGRSWHMRSGMPSDQESEVKALRDFLRSPVDAASRGAPKRCGVDDMTPADSEPRAAGRDTEELTEVAQSVSGFLRQRRNASRNRTAAGRVSRNAETLDEMADRLAKARGDGMDAGLARKPNKSTLTGSAFIQEAKALEGEPLTINPVPSVLHETKVPGVSADLIEVLATMGSPKIMYLSKYADGSFFQEALQVFDTAMNVGIMSDTLMTDARKISVSKRANASLQVSCLGQEVSTAARVFTVKVASASASASSRMIHFMLLDMPPTEPVNFVSGYGVVVSVKKAPGAEFPLAARKWKFVVSASSVASTFKPGKEHQAGWTTFTDNNAENKGIVMFRYNAALDAFDKMLFAFEK